jgi:hypothetical protein
MLLWPSEGWPGTGVHLLSESMGGGRAGSLRVRLPRPSITHSLEGMAMSLVALSGGQPAAVGATSAPEPSSVLAASQTIVERPARTVLARWGGHDVLTSEGFVPVAVIFLKYAARLKPHGLTPAESLFVIQLLVHKWDSNAPFPGYKTLAERMGVSVVYARQLARRLQQKGLLRRTLRKGDTNKFDLEPLFAALARHATAEDPSKAKSKRSTAARSPL